MNKLTCVCAALALTAGGCSTKKQSGNVTEIRHGGTARIEMTDSVLRIVAASIDSPEIVLESPTLHGGKAIVRGRRLRAVASAEQVSHAESMAEASHTERSKAETHEEREPVKGGFGQIIPTCLIAIIITILVALLRKFL